MLLRSCAPSQPPKGVPGFLFDQSPETCPSQSELHNYIFVCIDTKQLKMPSKNPSERVTMTKQDCMPPPESRLYKCGCLTGMKVDCLGPWVGLSL